MINPIVKLIAVDGFFTKQHAKTLALNTQGLQYVEKEFGKEIENFNMVPENCNKLFSDVLGTQIVCDEDKSGVFRKPELFIHFEPFENSNQWIFVAALETTMFNVFEHHSGCQTALQGYQFNYRNLFEWNVVANYELQPGHGVLFRPWLFHGFGSGLIQLFRLEEK